MSFVQTGFTNQIRLLKNEILSKRSLSLQNRNTEI